MTDSIQLKELVDAIEFQSELSTPYYHGKSRSVVIIGEEELFAAQNKKRLEDSPEWQRKLIITAQDFIENEQDYIYLPDQVDIDEWSIMERFAKDNQSPQIQQQIITAITGKGAFSRFKDLIRYFDEENKFTFTEEHGVTSEQFQNFLVSQEPHIVHYGGHGETEGIVLEDEDLEGDVLAAILENSDNTQIVVLNACYSLEIAKEVAKHIPYVIGTQDAIDDSAATAFARGFYTGLVSGRSVEKAFKNGLISIKRKKLPDADVLVLVKGIKN